MSPSQERRNRKRREATVDRALAYLRDGLQDTAARLGTAERQIHDSPRPMATAKRLVKEWRERQEKVSQPTTSFSQDRAALIRRAVAIELGHGWPA